MEIIVQMWKMIGAKELMLICQWCSTCVVALQVSFVDPSRRTQVRPIFVPFAHSVECR